MSPRKISTIKKKKKAKDCVDPSGRSTFLTTSISVASIKEKTRQGLKRLTSKSSIGKQNAAGPSHEDASVGLSSKKNSHSSPAIKVYRPRSDENTPQRTQPSRKVKTCKGPKQRHNSDIEVKRRVPVSVSSALQEMKGNFSKAVETVTTKFRINRTGMVGRRRSIRQSQYDPLLSGETPVKLYSPFAIGEFENTPTGSKQSGDSGKVQGSASSSTRTTPKNRRGKRQSLKTPSNRVSRNLLDTPTGKFREDLEDMRKGFEELTSLTRRLRDRSQQETIWG